MPMPRVFLGDWTVAASLGRSPSDRSDAGAADAPGLVRPPPPSPRRLLRARHKAIAAAAAAEWSGRAGGASGDAPAGGGGENWVPLARRRQSLARAVSTRRPGGPSAARVAPAL